MARLRTLYIGTDTTGDTEHHRRILILDGVTQDEAKGVNLAPEQLKAAGIPPLLVFGYDVDIPEEDQENHDVDQPDQKQQPRDYVLHINNPGDAAMKEMIRKVLAHSSSKRS